MIVVMGATGYTGSALIERLVELNVPVRALSRDPERLAASLDATAQGLVEVRQADAADPESLRAAFAGATQLFLSMVNSPQQVALETRVIEIAEESGIEHVVRLSAPHVSAESPIAIARWHHTLDEALKASRMRHTLLRPYAFMQKLLLLSPAISGPGIITGAMQDAPGNYTDVRDIADVAAAALTNPVIAGGDYSLTAAKAYTFGQVAEILSGMLDKPVRYVDLPPEVFERSLIERSHMPDWLAAHIVEVQLMAVAQLEVPTTTIADLLGREPRTLEDFLAENIQQFT